MKKFLLMFVAVTALAGVRGQNEGLTLVGEESKKVEADMMVNAHYLGALEGVDIWLTRSDDGVKGLANKRDWHVVKLGEALVPIERADLPQSHRCQLLGAVATRQDVNGIHGASILLVDSSATGRTTIFRAKVTMDTLRLVGGSLDTVDSYTYGRKDTCRVWSSVSPNGKYLAVLTMVRYKERKNYISVTKVFDENLNEVWAKDFSLGDIEAVYVDDNGTVYTMGQERTSNGMRFLTNVMSKNGAESYRSDIQCEPVHDLQIVNMIGKKVLCAGLFTALSADPEKDLTSGVVTMVFDIDSLKVTNFKARYFQNEDKNILLNKHTIRVQREHDMPMVAMLGSIRTPYGAVVAVGHHHKLRYVNANGSVSKSFCGRGIHMFAIDASGNVKWERNIRRNDVTDISDEVLALHMFAVDDKVYLVKNESCKEPAIYDIAKEGCEYELGDKSNLALYGITANGEVTKALLEKKTKHVLANVGCRADGSWVLLSFRGSKCRMAVLK